MQNLTNKTLQVAATKKNNLRKANCENQKETKNAKETSHGLIHPIVKP